VRNAAAAAFAAAVLAACGGEPDALRDRVAELERRLDARDALDQRLAAALREHGIRFHADAPANTAEATARALADLEAALDRLESAKVHQDNIAGQSAMTAVDTALATLRQDAANALAALLARAEAAAPPRQAALLECYGKVGGAAAVPALVALAGTSAKPAALRVQAARSLVEIDPPAAIPAVESLLQEAAAPPDLYLLVHLLAASGRAEALPVIASALRQSRDRSVRCHAATGLGNFRGEPAVAALAAAAVEDEYPAVRTNALRALAKVAATERVRAVAEQVLARDQDAAVRAVARELAPDGGR
jgi:hypothetical protein